MSRTSRFTFNSVRAYRRFLDEVARQCYKGERPFEDATRAAAIAKVGAELLMVEQTLAATGVVDAEPQAPHGDIGASDLPEPGLFTPVKMTEKTGISAKGTPIEENKTEHLGGVPRPMRPQDF
jgi:hypothetical protein